MIKLNGYWYDHSEVQEALEKKGYTVIFVEHEQDKRGNDQSEWLAIKDGQSHAMQAAALKEFHKKPPLM